MFTKDQAKKLLSNQIDAAQDISRRPRFSPEFKKWHRDTQVVIGKVFPGEARHLKDFNKISYSLGMFSTSTPDSRFTQAFLDGVKNACSILQSMVEEIERFGIETTDELGRGPMEVITRICNRFHLVVRQLRSRYDSRSTMEIEDEYDVQDLLHALLCLEFDDIRPEEWTPSYAGGSSRMDFLVKKEQIVIEVKKTRKNMGAKEVGDQLIIDIDRYREHPDCKQLICFVYDPEARVGNPRGVENDLSKDRNGVSVKVIIAPSGK